MSDANSIELPEITDKRFFGHPMGLAVLFFAEMWERFSYYGMRALLIFYLTEHWLLGENSNLVYGAYTSLVYITPVLGGYLADKFLGQRKAVTYGALLLTLGHGLMAFEGEGGSSGYSIQIFYLALAFIIVGSGFLKANISVIVGQLYPKADFRRDGAYTIFYMGINLGAALGAIVCGYLGQSDDWGWKYGFGAAGVGMLLGLVVFVFRQTVTPWSRRVNPSKTNLPLRDAPLRRGHCRGHRLLVACSKSGDCWLATGNPRSSPCPLRYLTAVVKLTPVERDRIFACMFLIFGSILFWALFEQAGSSLNLLTDKMVDKNIFGFDVAASMFQSINAIYIVLLAPVFAFIWTFLGARGLEPSAGAKFGLGMIQLGAGFLILVVGANSVEPGALIPVLFIFLIYLLLTPRVNFVFLRLA